MLFSIRNQCFEVKKYYNGSEKKFLCQRLHLKNGFGVLKYLLEKDYQVDDLQLSKGSVSLGFFWEGRNYNIYQWMNGNEVLATYFNISDNTTLSRNQFCWRDLILDILIKPGNDIKILDEKELEIVKNPAILQIIERTRDHILQNYKKIMDEIAEIRNTINRINHERKF